MVGVVEEQVQPILGQRATVGGDESFGHPRQIPVAHQAGPVLRCQQEAGILVRPYAAHILDRQVGVGHQVLVFIEEQDPGRVGQGQEDALGAVLKEPAALFVGGVVAVDEGDGVWVGDDLTAQTPAAATVEGQPTIDGGYIGPAGHAAQDAVIHIYPQPGIPADWLL